MSEFLLEDVADDVEKIEERAAEVVAAVSRGEDHRCSTTGEEMAQNRSDLLEFAHDGVAAKSLLVRIDERLQTFAEGDGVVHAELEDGAVEKNLIGGDDGGFAFAGSPRDTGLRHVGPLSHSFIVSRQSHRS